MCMEGKTTFPLLFQVFVVVREWVGKEFPDMRQNERRIKFIRVRDSVRTVDWLKGEPNPFAG